MICPKCGKEMDSSWRCCLACGALNENNLANNLNNSKVSLSSNITMYSVNFVLYIIILIALLVIRFSNNILDSFIFKFGIITVIYFYFFCTQLLLEKAHIDWWKAFIPIYNIFLIFKIAYGNGWHFLTLFVGPVVYIVGMYLNLKQNINIVNYTNIVSIIILFVIFLALVSNVGHKFGKNSILTVIFLPIVIPYIAFSKKTNYYENY